MTHNDWCSDIGSVKGHARAIMEQSFPCRTRDGHVGARVKDGGNPANKAGLMVCRMRR